jgi:glycosyltransferase involved in cell wall biosynthesis
MSGDIGGAPDVFGLALLTQAQRYVWLRRADLRENAVASDPAGICEFLCWWYARGVAEYPAFAGPPTDEQYASLVEPAFAASPQAPPISHFLAHVWRERTDLCAVYPLETVAGRRGFVEWILLTGRAEVPIQDLWIDQALRDWLLSPDPEMLPVPRFALDLWKARPDLRNAHDLGSADDRQRLRDWFWAHGILEHRLGWMLDAPADPRLYLPPGAAAPYASKWCAPPARDEGVNLVGFPTAEFGLGEDLRMAAKALGAAGIPFSVFQVPAGLGVHRRDRSVSRWISGEMPFRTTILCMAAFEAADFYLRYGKEVFAERFVIGYWPWELPRWPALWANVFDLVGEVWASSRFTQAAFSASAPVPVLHMPMAVDLPRVEPQPRARFAMSDGVFQFLLVFDWHSWPARKNPTAAVAAFRLAFPAGTEPVGLTIKMIGLEPWSADFAAFKALADADRRITLLSGTLDRSVLAALYKCCDAYVSLHRAEGFGRTMAEAMLMGKPVVATNWSGNIDFLDASSGCPVEFTLRPLENGEYPYAEGQVWAEPDVRSAAQWLRWLAADWARASALGRAGRERIVEQYGVAAVGARYAERLHMQWRSRADRAAKPKPVARTARRQPKRKATAEG